MPALASVRHGNKAIPVGPLCVAPENQEEITEEDKPVKYMMKREMNAEVDQENLPLEDRYGITSKGNLIKDAHQVKPGNEIRARVSRGTIAATVKKTTE
mgnify:CR=1 FL=1